MQKRLAYTMIALAVIAPMGCASQSREVVEKDVISRPDNEVATAPASVYQTVGGISLGEPMAVSVDFEGNPVIADRTPGRIVKFIVGKDEVVEYQRPSQSLGFNPSDARIAGFFVYVVDDVRRVLLRFDHRGAYRDVLVDFNGDANVRRSSPFGLDVDSSDRIVVSDIENHRVILIDSYLQVELAFGSYGSHPGQFDTPGGVSFVANGGIMVVDSGNRRIQFFDAVGTYLKSVPSEANNPLVSPRRATMDGNGNLFVADPEAGRVFVFDADGALVRSIFPEDHPSFHPTDVEVTRSGLIYVTDPANNSLFVFR